MFNNLDTGMTKDRYLNMREQMGREPIPEEIPPDINDFPYIVQNAISTFNMLGDRVQADIGYVGKDYANLAYFIEIYDVQDTEFFLELLTWMDSRAIKKSSDKMKKEYDKLKRKK